MYNFKKAILFFLLVILSFNLLISQEWIPFSQGRAEGEPEHRMLSSSASMVEFDLDIPGMYSRMVDGYNRVNIPGIMRQETIGEPELPVLTYTVAIPECRNVDLDIIPINTTKITGMNIYPTPDNEEHLHNGEYIMSEVFAIDQAVYAQSTNYPGINGELGPRGAMRAQHCVQVKVYPVQFNPAE